MIDLKEDDAMDLDDYARSLGYDPEELKKNCSMNQEPFDREKFTADFENWLKENREKVLAKCITLEELTNDPEEQSEWDYWTKVYEESVLKKKL